MRSRIPNDATPFYMVVWLLTWPLRFLTCHMTIDGLEHVPRSGGFVLACNHTMGPDYVALGHACSRQVFYMAKSEAFTVHPLLTRFLFAVGVFPVKRGSRDQGALQGAVEVVQQGRALGMFPEGTRSRDGKLQRAHSGATRVAMMAAVPMIPAAVVNSETILGGFFKLRKPKVSVRFGPAITLDGDVHDVAAVKANTGKMMAAIAELLPEERRGMWGKGEIEH